MAAPAPGFGVDAEAGFDGISSDVLLGRGELGVVGDELVTEAALEDVPGGPVAAIEVPRVVALEVAHAGAQVRIAGADDQVQVVRHQAVGKDLPVVSLSDAFQDHEIRLPITVVQKQRKLENPSREQVIGRTRKKLPNSSSHTT